MATVKAPLMSLDASGSIANTLTFSRWRGRRYVRENVTPTNPNTGLQQGVRATFRFITQIYASLSTLIKGHWDAAGKPTNITGLDAAVQLNQTRARQNLGLVQDPTAIASVVEAAPAGPAAAPQPKSLVVTWTDSIGAGDWGTMIWMSTTNAFTPDISNLIRVIPHGVEKFTVTKLETGTPYYFQVAGLDKGGDIGTHSAQFTGTPT